MELTKHILAISIASLAVNQPVIIIQLGGNLVGRCQIYYDTYHKFKYKQTLSSQFVCLKHLEGGVKNLPAIVVF
jgi:hypothetical protein